MDIRRITPGYAVSPQIAPEDLETIRAEGFGAVICNRPDAEVPPAYQADAIARAAEAAGLAFHVLPLTHQTMTPDNVARQAELIGASDAPVLAYCASGTRCSVVWALGQAETRSPDDVLSDAARAGYDLSGLRPTLEAVHARAQG